jgi:hypothetical protein
VAGEPVNRYMMRHVRWSAPMAQVAAVHRPDPAAREVTLVRLTLPSSLLLIAMSNPLWIAPTAPGRWADDRLRKPPPSTRAPVSGH